MGVITKVWRKLHQDVHERLKAHLEQLKLYGFIDENDFSRLDEKLSKLNKIDAEFLADITEIHDKHFGEPELFANLVPVLQHLHEDIELIKEEHRKKLVNKKDVIVVNKFISDIKNMVEQKINADLRKEKLSQLADWGMDVSRYPDLAEFLMQHWDDAVKLYEVSHKTDAFMHLFRDALPSIEHIINENTWPTIFEDLIHLMESKKKELGNKLDTFFQLAFPKMSPFVTMQNWKGYLELIESTDTDYARFIVNKVFPELWPVISKLPWQTVINDFIRILGVMPTVEPIYWELLIDPRIKKLITVKNWASFINDYIEIVRAFSAQFLCNDELVADTFKAIIPRLNENNWSIFADFAKQIVINKAVLTLLNAPIFNSVIYTIPFPEMMQHLADLAKVNGNLSPAINALIFGEPTTKKTFPALIKIIDAVGPEKAAPLIKSIKEISEYFVNSRDWPAVVRIVLRYGDEYSDVFKNPRVMYYFITAKLRGEEFGKEEFVKNFLKNVFGFVPEGDQVSLFKLASASFLSGEEKIIKKIFSKPIEKVFPLGKQYGGLNVAGIVKLSNPVELVDYFVTYVLSRNPEKLDEPAFSALFEIDKLKAARNYLYTSDLKPAKIFKDIKQDIDLVKSAQDRGAAERIVLYFTDIAARGQREKVEPLADIILNIKSLFVEPLKFNYVTAKMQSGVVTDLFDSKNTMCCAFYPDGQNKRASFDYIQDPYIGLLQLKAAIKESGKEAKEIEIVGAAIMALCTDKDNKKVLLVDSVEGNQNHLDCMKEMQWKDLFFNALIQIKKDVGADYILFFCSEILYDALVNGLPFYGLPYNVTPRIFLKYLHSVKKLKYDKADLKKLGELDIRYLEAFGGWKKPEGEVNGFILE